MSGYTILGIVSVLLIILWNAFFVAAEYAFVSIRPTRLAELSGQGNRRARMVQRMVQRPSRFISAFQLAVTLSSLALGAIGEPAVAKLFETIFGGESEIPGGVVTTTTVALVVA